MKIRRLEKLICVYVLCLCVCDVCVVYVCVFMLMSYVCMTVYLCVMCVYMCMCVCVSVKRLLQTDPQKSPTLPGPRVWGRQMSPRVQCIPSRWFDAAFCLKLIFMHLNLGMPFPSSTRPLAFFSKPCVTGQLHTNSNVHSNPRKMG